MDVCICIQIHLFMYTFIHEYTLAQIYFVYIEIYIYMRVSLTELLIVRCPTPNTHHESHPNTCTYTHAHDPILDWLTGLDVMCKMFINNRKS